MNEENNDIVALATDLTVAWLSNPNTRAGADDIPAFLASVHSALSGLISDIAVGAAGGDAAAVEHVPAVSVRKSLASPDRIISMIDGRPYSSLTRHLKANGLTPAEYRERYGLKPDYPIVAPGFSEARRAVAKRLGLGRKKGDKVGQKSGGEAATADKPAPKVRNGKGIAAAKAAAKAHLGGNG